MSLLDVDVERHFMTGSDLPKMDGSVVDGNGNPVEGTDWKYGGDGNESITPEAKKHSSWDDEW